MKVYAAAFPVHIHRSPHYHRSRLLMKDRWDGTVKGVPQQPGVFVWMLSYTNRDTKQKVFKKGTVTLIR